jgi:hypothetical protein
MRIISDKKDYYDCLQGTDGDRDAVWLRHPEEFHYHPFKEKIDAEKKDWPFPTLLKSRFIQQFHVIGFCGKVYPCLSVIGTEVIDKCSTCFTLEQTLEAFEKVKMTKEERDYHLGKNVRKLYFIPPARVNELKEFFADFKKKESSYLEMFVEKKTPVFVARYKYRDHWMIIYNDCDLKRFGFFRLFNPQQAYQEINMFYSNIARPMKPIPKLSDETLIEVHGFDKKTSFRKDPIR